MVWTYGESEGKSGKHKVNRKRDYEEGRWTIKKEWTGLSLNEMLREPDVHLALCVKWHHLPAAF